MNMPIETHRENYTLFITDTDTYSTEEFRSVALARTVDNSGIDPEVLEKTVPAFLFVAAYSGYSDFAIVLGIAKPTLDDVPILMAFADLLDAESLKRDMVKYVSALQAGGLSNDEIAKKVSEFCTVLQRVLHDIKEKVEKAHDSCVLREYDSLRNVLQDPFVDNNGTIYVHEKHYFAKSSSAEFALGEASMHESFLAEHAVKYGTVSDIRNRFSLVSGS